MLRQQEYKGFKWRLCKPFSHNREFIGLQVFVAPCPFELSATDVYDLVSGKKHHATINAEIRRIIDAHESATNQPPATV